MLSRFPQGRKVKCFPFSMFLQYSYNLVDSMFVAKIDEQALAAVSLSFPITTLMNALSIWIGVGVNVLIAGYLDQNNQKKANAAVTLGLLLSVLIGVTVNIATLFCIWLSIRIRQ